MMGKNNLPVIDNRTLRALEQRRARLGSLGALDFLIARERARQTSEELLASSAKPVGNINGNRAASFRSSAAVEFDAPVDSVIAPGKSRAKDIPVLLMKIWELGFTDAPLAELESIAAHDPAAETRAKAASELALWHRSMKTDEGLRIALSWLAKARQDTAGRKQLDRLAVIELMCYWQLGDAKAARLIYEQRKKAGELSPGILLAWANFQSAPEAKIALINQALTKYQIPAISLSSDTRFPVYDRLQMAAPVPPIHDGPLVTVLIAAYEAAATLPTALRSLQEQSWKNLEIIVLDDSSPTPGTLEVAQRFAAADARIRVERMPHNGGAYVARNHGLDLATGEFVTIHDADDWSHPLKIETQARYMVGHPKVMGCTSEQARCRDDLSFPRCTGGGSFILTNTSSFMFRRLPVTRALGYWDSVRFSADNEFIRRIQCVFGGEAVQFLHTGPYSFQRDSDMSIVADEFFGASKGRVFGVRRQYLEAQLNHHRDARRLKYGKDPLPRPFPVPRAMLLSPAQARQQSSHYDVVLGSDFRMVGGSTQSNAQEIAAQKRAGLRTAIVPMFWYDLSIVKTRPILPEIWEQVDGELVNGLAFGERVTCDLLILRYPPILQHMVRYMPQIEAKEIRVIVNQPPMSDYGAKGVLRYSLQRCAENLRSHFGKDAIWHPIGPLVREALLEHHASELHHIQLSGEDWPNIIDVDEWNRGMRPRRPQDKLRIGRHSRDHAHKWPADRDELLAVYPAADDLEVHVLGGSKTPARVLGRLPSNWVVHEFGSMRPMDFLAEIDVFIYFANPAWVESFGRTILEAMAVGVPAILPEFYRPLFKDAALYATPQTAVGLARELHADRSAYAAQAARAQDFVRTWFGFDMHLRRLRELGVRGGK